MRRSNKSSRPHKEDTWREHEINAALKEIETKEKDRHRTKRRDDAGEPQRHHRRVEQPSSSKHKSKGDHHRSRATEERGASGDAKHRSSRRKDEGATKSQESKHRSSRHRGELNENTNAEVHHKSSRHPASSEKHRSKDERHHSRKSKDHRKAEELASKIQEINATASSTAKEEEDYNDYADDFDEDAYNDDDFDEFDDDKDEPEEEETSNDVAEQSPARQRSAHVSDVIRAMQAENETVSSRESSKIGSGSSERSRLYDAPVALEPVPRESKSKFAVFDFTSAHKKAVQSAAMGKAQRRAHELSPLVEMDYSSFDLFTLAPMTEYELYMTSFGRANAKQSSTQTNDDCLERDCQTEPISYRQKWCQHPAEDMIGSGKGDDNEVDDFEEPTEQTAKKIYNPHKLGEFVQKAGQVMLILLDEQPTMRISGKPRSGTAFSDSHVRLENLPYLSNRAAVKLSFADSNTKLFMACYPPSGDITSTLHSTGFLAIWNINQPSSPQKLLAVEAAPLCCCFSPYKARLAFAGLESGSIALWDLNEPTSEHRIVHLDGDSQFLVRHPSYQTACVLDDDNHQSPVVDIRCLTSRRSISDETYQVCSLEQLAVVNIWVVIELISEDDDLGLSPCSKIKLIRSSTISLTSPADRYLQATCFSCPSDDSTQVFVATDTGTIVHKNRYGINAWPAVFQNFDELAVAACIQFAPFDDSSFLVAYGTGSLCLFHTSQDEPLLTWSHLFIQQCSWSSTRPSVFFAIDRSSKILIFDLLINRTQPVAVQDFGSANLVDITVGLSSDQQSYVALNFDDGKIELHTVKKEFCSEQENDLERFKRLVFECSLIS